MEYWPMALGFFLGTTISTFIQRVIDDARVQPRVRRTKTRMFLISLIQGAVTGGAIFLILYFTVPLFA